jgi:endonuclease III
MAANILARDFKIPFSDHYSIDVSVDRHIKRVLRRLELVPADATNDEIIFRARALSPEFPGLIDFPCWEIGRKWCRPNCPQCGDCLMVDLCPTARHQTVEVLS